MNDEEVNEPRHPPRQSMSINLYTSSRDRDLYDTTDITYLTTQRGEGRD